MSAFVKNFTLIIGDCIPFGNTVWEMFLVLLQIIEIVTSEVVNPDLMELLKTLIAEHHIMYISFFGNLKPKHHLLLHYPRLLGRIGPLKNVSSIRFEGKHRQMKAAANAVSSRRNILYTMALKNQLIMCHRLLAKNGFSSTTEIGSEDINFLQSKEYTVFAAFLNFNVPTNEYFATMWIKINGIKYAADLILVTDYVDFLPVFGVIHSIIVKQNPNEVYFILNKLRTLVFNEHYLAYEIDKTNINLFCKQWTDLHSNFPTVMHSLNGKLLVHIN